MPPSTPLFAEHAVWRSVFWVSYWAWIGVELWIWSRDRRAAKGQRKDRGSLGVLMLLIPAGLVAAFFAAFDSAATRITAWPAALFWSAIALIWLGIGLRTWAVITLGRFFRITVFVHEDHRLITTGPYRWLRNPSYTGGLITMVGIGLALGNWLSLALAAAGLLIAYRWRITAEEKALRERFGQAYADYEKRSWALIPLIW